MTIDVLYMGLLHGLVLSIIAFGIMIPFRFLNFPDLTAEGAYPLGGAICASLLIAGVPQVLAIMCSMITCGVMGICTSQISLRLKVNSLLAGIILSTMAYSINLRIMGKPNIALFGMDGISFEVIPLIVLILLCVIPFGMFLHTDFGLRFRTIGNNPKFAVYHGININQYTSLGLFTGGCAFGLAGSLTVQIQQFMDVGMGVGIVIHGLASLMIGESIVGNSTIRKQLVAPIVGALVYQQIQGLALSFGLAPSDLKFFTGSVVLIVLAIQQPTKSTKDA
ncbi:ABC transporter permease [Rickettsiales endosymbiont of Peranema trichophorum]|uniref:ABC transporter permease n=1 Tax=Rickettsiales endosymbiont of Peranema trichophorum TaxID=2486577 RepID=UPI00102310EA|nr:ABC transporter permease [Rickettsiales endosymbiont of Peranema trichophorum]RZI47308.1 ABC transporter permease [Rickettsiales endosymbiont of Peranema trichophorum]